MYKTIPILAACISLFVLLHCTQTPKQPAAPPANDAADEAYKDGLTAFNKKDWSKADSLIRVAERLWYKQEWPSLHWVDTRVVLAKIVRRRHGADAAIDSLRADIAVLQPLKPELSGRLNFNVAYAYGTKEDFVNARHYYEQARLSHEQHGIPVTKLSGEYLYKALANIYTRLGEYEKALSLLKTGLDSCIVQRHRIGIPMIHHDLCVAYRSLNKPEIALQHATTGVDSLSKLPDNTQQEVPDLNSALKAQIAHCFWMMNKSEEATQWAQQALALNDENTEALLVLGNINAKQNNISAADTLYKKVANQYTANLQPLDRELGKVLLSRAVLYTTTNPDLALGLCQQALTCVLPAFKPKNNAENPNPNSFYPENTILEALDLKSRICWEQYRRQPSTAQLVLTDTTTALALEANDQLLSTYNFESSTLYALELTRTLHERYIQVLMARQATSPIAAARLAAFFERSRVQLLRQKLSRESALIAAPIPQAMRDREQQLRQRQKENRNRIEELKAKDPKHPDIGSLHQLLFYIEEEHQRLIDTFAQQYPAYFKVKYGRSSTTLADIQALLPDATTCFIAYFYNARSGALYSMGVQKNSVHYAEKTLKMSDLEAFSGLITNEQLGLQNEGDPFFLQQFSEAAKALYDTLVAPVVSTTPKNLIIAPDGILGNLPFDLLLSRAPNATEQSFATLPYLLRSTAVRFVPSATVLLESMEHSRLPPQRGYWGIAPHYTDHFPAVRYGKDCVSDLAKLYSGQQSSGPKTTKSLFTQMAPESQIIHFYGHGEANGNQPELSYIAFAKGYGAVSATSTSLAANTALPPEELECVLFAHEISLMSLSADLVVLSACETGMGKEAGSEGIFSLARAFQAAGCPSAAMTLWKVDDQATARLTTLFLNNIRQGIFKDEALRKAKLDYLAEAPSAIPYYWSGMVLTGDARPLTLMQGENTAGLSGMVKYGVVALLLLIFVVLYQVFRHKS